VSEQLLPRDRTKRWLLALGAWTLIVLVYATRSGIARGSSSLESSAAGGWAGALAGSVALWGAWALLAPLIVEVDRRLPVGRDTIGRRLLLHVPLSLAFAAAQLSLTGGLERLLGAPHESFWLSDGAGDALLRLVTSWALVIYWSIVGIFLAFEHQEHVKNRQIKTVELEKLLAESRFDTLRTRLHPHVLFNALNAISAHVEDDPRTARWILEQFGSLLRLSLEHDREPEIPLERELAYVETYIDLQKVRFADRLEVITKIEPEVRRAFVPTFILQPLVENAIRHGIATRTTPGQIAIHAWRENGSLRLSVRDDGPGLPDGWNLDRGLGEGLSNTRERLERLYGDDQSLDIAGKPGSGVHVALTLPFRETEGPRSSGPAVKR
jgi:signal transduction histidine kinase